MSQTLMQFLTVSAVYLIGGAAVLRPLRRSDDRRRAVVANGESAAALARRVGAAGDPAGASKDRGPARR